MMCAIGVDLGPFVYSIRELFFYGLGHTSLSRICSLKYPSIEDTENGFFLRQSVRASHVILGLVANEITSLKPVLSPASFIYYLGASSISDAHALHRKHSWDFLPVKNKPTKTPRRVSNFLVSSRLATNRLKRRLSSCWI